MSIGTLPKAQTELIKQDILAQLGVEMPDTNLPYTVQAKLIYLIENLGLTDIPSSDSLQVKIDEIMSFLTPPSTCTASSLTLGTTQQTIIAAETTGNVRKGFSVFNESSTAIVYIDYVTGVTSTKKKLQLPPLYFWEAESVFQGDVFAISSEASSSIEVRVER